MATFTWNDSYNTGVAEIDKQHRGLVDLVNNLFTAMKEGKGKDVLGKVLDELIRYTDIHFKTEEKLFAEHGYPLAEEHAAIHQALSVKVLDIYRRWHDGHLALSVETANFLQDWLLNHINGEDKKYSPFFAKKGVK